MIPERIFVRQYWMQGELDDDWHSIKVHDDDVEYVRKDALVDWLDKRQKERIGNKRADIGYREAMEEVITFLEERHREIS